MLEIKYEKIYIEFETILRRIFLDKDFSQQIYFIIFFYIIGKILLWLLSRKILTVIKVNTIEFGKLLRFYYG